MPDDKVCAADIKAALRKRHPGRPDKNVPGPGRWVVLEEWLNIDLLALDTWRSGEIVGYEVKVSRSDMRSELLDPSKRAQAVATCTRFYFAVPAEMLKPDERAWEEPEWEPSDFERPMCTNPKCTAGHKRRGFLAGAAKPRGKRLRGTRSEGVSVHLGYYTERGTDKHGATYTHSDAVKACCVVCKGFGSTGKSRVEQIAPTLWIPRDTGLVAVGPRGCTVLREAPRRKVTEPVIPWPFIGYRMVDGTPAPRHMDEATRSRLERQAIAKFARWVSWRPDPRHTGSYPDTVDP